ncbi:MFS transporter [Mangrovicoccus sp. HB161399]|uniref:MFS transporter n=1 Tax=Mangrovicoccus sp. HB161399 TaxID=2720392 RepID=UPI0015528DBD|nr:MFS transporter [Mangrovicoccus sp. HB161399]
MAEPDAFPFAPFRNRRFLLYWLAGLSANFGWLIQMVGASWLMTSLDARPEMVALVQTSVALPVMLFSLPAGAMADAFGRRTTVLWSQAYLLAMSSALAALAFLGTLGPWSLLAFTFLIGSGKALNNPAWQTMVSELVKKEELAPAIALNSVGFNIARSVGPAIGGAIVAGVGAFAAFLVNACANLTILVAASRWKTPPRDMRLPPERIGSAIVAGLRYVAMSPAHLVICLRGFTLNLAGISVMALMPLVARDLVGGGPQTYGMLLGGFGGGAILGAFLGTRMRSRWPLETCIRIGFLACAAAAAILGASSWFLLSMAAAALAGAFWLVTLSSFNTTVQLSSPRWVLSRCHATYQSCNFAGYAAGGWLWGEVAGQAGTGPALIASGGLLAVFAGLGLVLPLRELDASGLDQHAPWVTPEASIDMLPKSGPIVTSIEYRIGAGDTDRFLAVMAERRRARLRDGARAWTLSRDIRDPEVWIERFRTPTWIETQRLHLRRTVAGAHVAEKLRALHKGPGRWTTRYELVRPAAPPSGSVPVPPES